MNEYLNKSRHYYYDNKLQNQLTLSIEIKKQKYKKFECVNKIIYSQK
ncbi:conserved hypothetical protein [Xenorhabdus nematophila F1]|uniref:Uncharacterized protein n=1 Tax=Xenorhabdus nematophila (strain ATCC 19061 / DSM 3370 / CCUG 14189 / LMG 1036 / NCIMB 9965 / AN6) TaxID=406817 RepID=D3VEX8_XENNA|nr:conserved hypothetical protein [Xenorhabdus nematophila ATCC 19061]CCW31283.1 conserved hypothetical protein [Xenorhabdus nematophila F1]CEF30056.1 conserved hypothetical protein [Xenorhabdus nematophila str. Websteri]CEK25253.1 conserved hypothetical protein [Xenorhabdus nematophila AN6/1]